jgi:hypothetical protein
LTEERFPLPASSYKELSKVIQAYGQLKKAGSLTEVSKLATVGATIVSANNRFLVATGVIAGGKAKMPTEPGAELAHALQLDMTDQVVKSWRRVLIGNEFIEKVLSAVRIRRGMERSALQTHVVFTAGHPRNKTVMTGAATVIDILMAAQLLIDSEGKLVAADVQLPLEGKSEGTSTVTADLTLEDRGPGVTHQKSPSFATSVRGVPLQIQIQLQCTPDQLDDLGPRLRRLLDELSTSAETTTD